MTLTKLDGGTQSNLSIAPEDLLVSPQMQSQLINDAMTSLGLQNSLSVINPLRTDSSDSAAPGDAVPELDGADETLAALADLEAFMAYMEMEATEEQIKAAKKRIEDLKGELEKCHADAMEKIEKSIKEMKKSERAALANRIIGWFGVIMAFAAAIVTTVLTGGVAAGLAFASAGLALTSMILSETGATEKICDAMAKSIASHGDLSKDEAKMAANLIFGAIFMIATLATGIGGGVAAAGAGVREGLDIAEKTVKLVTTISAVVNSVSQLGGIAGGIGGTVTGYLAGLAQVNVTEHQMTSADLEKMLEQIQEEFDQLVELLNSAIAQLAQLLEARQQNEEELAMEIAG